MIKLFTLEEVIEFANYYHNMPPLKRVTLFTGGSLQERTIDDIADEWHLDYRNRKGVCTCPSCGNTFNGNTIDYDKRNDT